MEILGGSLQPPQFLSKKQTVCFWDFPKFLHLFKDILYKTPWGFWVFRAERYSAPNGLHVWVSPTAAKPAKPAPSTKTSQVLLGMASPISFHGIFYGSSEHFFYGSWKNTRRWMGIFSNFPYRIPDSMVFFWEFSEALFYLRILRLFHHENQPVAVGYLCCNQVKNCRNFPKNHLENRSSIQSKSLLISRVLYGGWNLWCYQSSPLWYSSNIDIR